MSRIPPIISYVNILADAVLTASAETDDGAAANCVDGLTYDYWVPGADANIQFQMPYPVTVECFGVAAHTIASSGSEIKLEYRAGSKWVEASRPPVGLSDVTLFENFDPVTSDLFRVTVTGACAIGVLWVGPALRMERNLHRGHTPITLAENSGQRVNITELGELRGVAVTEKGARLEAAFKNLSADWVRSTFAPFVDSFNAGQPFFWAWHYDNFPLEVAYCWGNSGLSVTNSGPRDLMSATIIANAYLDGPPDRSKTYQNSGLWDYKVVLGSQPKIPAEYFDPEYDSSDWSVGQGGFGSTEYYEKTPVRTPINPGTGKAIWLRKTIGPVSLRDIKELLITVWHDDGAWLWVNGTEIALIPAGVWYKSTAVVSPADFGVGDKLVVVLQVIDSIPTGSPTNIYAGMDIQVSYN